MTAISTESRPITEDDERKGNELSVRIGDAVMKALHAEKGDEVPLEPIAFALASMCGAFIGAIPENQRGNVMKIALRILLDKAGVTNANLAVRTHTGDKLDS